MAAKRESSLKLRHSSLQRESKHTPYGIKKSAAKTRWKKKKKNNWTHKHSREATTNALHNHVSIHAIRIIIFSLLFVIETELAASDVFVCIAYSSLLIYSFSRTVSPYFFFRFYSYRNIYTFMQRGDFHGINL